MAPSPILLLCFLFISTTCALNSSSSSSTSTNSSRTLILSSIKSHCKSTPYPEACFNSLQLTLSINISPNILNFLLQTLQTALSEGAKLSNLFSSANLVEKQRGTLQDCKELHQITLSSLKKSMSRVGNSADSRKLADARAFLSAALTNKITCLEGLDSASGARKSSLINSLTSAYMHVSNSLSMISEKPSSPPGGGRGGGNRRRLLGFPRWLSRKARRVLLQISGDDYGPAGEVVVTVAADGSGNFSTVSDAINFAPNNSAERIFIILEKVFIRKMWRFRAGNPTLCCSEMAVM